jgi:hypothetical protein
LILLAGVLLTARVLSLTADGQTRNEQSRQQSQPD